MGGRKKIYAFEIEISKKAEFEINNICNYIGEEKGNPSAANNVKGKIYKKILTIQLTPFANKPWDGAIGLNRNIRKGVCLSWIILYEVLENKIEILKIIHRSKDNKSISV